MKDHKKKSSYVSLPGDGEPFEQFVQRITRMASELKEPKVANYGWGGVNLEIVGWVELTDEQKQAVKKRREASKKAAETRRLKKESAELEQLAKLKAKYEGS